MPERTRGVLAFSRAGRAPKTAAKLENLKIPPANQLEKLKGNLKGFHSIRINDQRRLVFRWIEGNAHDVRIIDYH